MTGYFWNAVLVVNSILWFAGVAFLTYATGMLFIALEWKQFLFALSAFIIITLIELVLTGLAHGSSFLLRVSYPRKRSSTAAPKPVPGK